MKNMNHKTYAIIIAAGNGSRMKSSLPKVLHRLGGQSLLGHVIDLSESIGADDMCLVLSQKLADALETKHNVAIQHTPEGTGHAVQQAMPWMQNKTGDVFILYGDSPFITAETLEKMRQAKAAKKSDIVILAMRPEDPKRYGRILLDEHGFVSRIVEYKDASDTEKQINLCNSGVMLCCIEALPKLLSKIKNDNAKKEYYLTDIVEINRQTGGSTACVEAPEAELMGVDSKADLAKAEHLFQETRRNDFLSAGVHLVAPETLFVSYDTEISPGAIIDPHVVIGPGVKIAPDAKVKPFSYIAHTTIPEKAVVGPFANMQKESN